VSAEPPAARTRGKPEVQRSRILNAAVEVFSRVGVTDASVGDIAAAAGVSRTLLYHYFPGKAEMVEALQLEAVAEIEKLVADARARGGSPAEQVTFMVHGYHDTLTARPSIVTSLTCGLASPPRDSQPGLERRIRRLRRSLLAWIEGLRPSLRDDIDPDELLLACLGALTIWFLPTPLGAALGARPGTNGRRLEAHKAAVTAILLDGLLSPGRAPGERPGFPGSRGSHDPQPHRPPHDR
jgi:AcrR family transcriptional regulator